MNNDRENTNRDFRPEDEAVRKQIVRMRVKRGTVRPDPDFPDDPDKVSATLVFICKLWDGLNEGATEIPVAVSEGRLVDDEIFAFRPDGGTNETNPETADTPGDPATEDRVIWREIFVLQRRYWIKITGYTPIADTTNRWQYSWEMQVVNRHGTFKAPELPDDSISTGVLAYNSIEANNSFSGWQGNSVNLDVLPPTVNVQPVQGQPVVRAWAETNCDGDPELIFSYENAITNICPGT